MALSINQAAALVTALFGIITAATWERVPEPYMDEIFHVKQTQQYCGGNFSSWDPMITTFPGAYVAAYAVARLVAAPTTLELSPSAWLCSTRVLRLINLAFGLLSFYCIVDILRHSSEDKPRRARSAAAAKPSPAKPSARPMSEAAAAAESSAVWGGLTLALSPLHFFFAFLFYTDGGANCTVLLAYALCVCAACLAHLIFSYICLLSPPAPWISPVFVVLPW